MHVALITIVVALAAHLIGSLDRQVEAVCIERSSETASEGRLQVTCSLTVRGTCHSPVTGGILVTVIILCPIKSHTIGGINSGILHEVELVHRLALLIDTATVDKLAVQIWREFQNLVAVVRNIEVNIPLDVTGIDNL